MNLKNSFSFVLMWIFDRYKKVKLIGKGATSEVYLVFHKFDRQYYALKQLYKSNKNLSHQHMWMTFHREVIHLSSLDHPRICNLKDTFEDKESFYIIMGYIAGVPLSSYQNVVEETAITFMYQIISIFLYIHSCNIYHLDMKPQNILIKNNQLYLIDFGTSRHATDTTKCSCATVDYASNEVLSGNIIDTSCDVYSFGVTFFVVIFQMFPMHSFCMSDMQAFLLTCCQKEKKKRFQNFFAVKEGLDKLMYKRVINESK